MVPGPCLLSWPSAMPHALLGPGPLVTEGSCSALIWDSSPSLAGNSQLSPCWRKLCVRIAVPMASTQGRVGGWRGAFSPAPLPIQAPCLPWELVRTEEFCRVLPVSSREKRSSGQMQQAWQWRGRETGREFFLGSLAAVVLEFVLIPALRQPQTFALRLHCGFASQLRVTPPPSGGPPDLSYAEPMKPQLTSLPNAQWTWASPEAL